MKSEKIAEEIALDTLSYWVSLARSIETNKREIDLLDLAGASRDERLYSWILYSLLVDENNVAIRRSFFEMIAEIMKTEKLHFSEFRVFREWSIPGGFVDLLIITEDKKKAIVIENKIDAGDQKDQLNRYYNHFEQKGFSTYLVYLTPFGHEPSEYSVKKEELNRLKEQRRFACLSYSDNILPWLNTILESENTVEMKSAVGQFIITTKGMLAMNKEVNKLVSAEYWNTDYSEIDKLKKVREALDILIYAKHATHFFKECVQSFLSAEELALDTSRLLYVCANKTYRDSDKWEKAICETGYKYYGIVYSFGLDIEPQRPLYGIRLSTEGNADQYKNKSYFGIYIGEEKTNPKNLKMESYCWDEEGKYSPWGQYIEVTTQINQNDYTEIKRVFSDLLQENKGY